VEKHINELIEELVVSSEGKTEYKGWNGDDGRGYERVLPPKFFMPLAKIRRNSYREPMEGYRTSERF